LAVSVIIPEWGGEKYPYEIRGAAEVIHVGEGPASYARNLGARRARHDELLFLDADMALPPDLDLSTLAGYGFDMATAYFRTDPWDALLGIGQNLLASVGHPMSFFGGFMYMKRYVFDDLGGFREVPAEDTEFAHRAWSRGWKISVFPFEVVHTRPFHWKNAVGPLLTEEGVWGLP
jgi:glycosyltransferase involved in cell wall biosynthesis